LLNTSRLIVTNFKGKVPKTIEDLLKLPGVGRKVGNIVLAQSFGQDAISVDTHVHRISNMLSWVKTKTPQQTEKALMERLPKKYWRDTNKLLVSIGRQYPSKRKLAKFLESLTS